MLNYIIRKVNPSIIDGFHIRWYGLFFGIGFFLSYLSLVKIFKNEGLQQNDADNLTFGTFIFLIIGLRLGHCLFYEPEYYLSNPLEILKIWEGGLASHGGAIGLICAFLWFSYKSKKTFWWVISRAAVVIPITAFFVRMGNLMNSEIYGIPTNLPWGFVFVRDALITPDADKISDILIQAGLVASNASASLHTFLASIFQANADAIPFESLYDVLLKYKFVDQSQYSQVVDAFVNAGQLTANHPTQIYEALAYLLTGFILMGYYQLRSKHKKPISDFVILAITLLMLFGSRFFVEFIKNDQVDFEQSMTLNMGQLLSIPFIIAGIAFVFVAIFQHKKQKQTNV